MISQRQLLGLDVQQAGRLMRRGMLSPVDLCEAYLHRIEETEPTINAYVTVDPAGAREDALRAALELSAGLVRGPLHGIPVGVKDLIDTAGLRTTYGSGRHRDHVPQVDAVIVARLREEGAVLLGKHATHEFAWGGRTDNPHFGPTRNPHDPMRIPGGSSGGGAASVTVRSCLLAIGTDTAGSVRIPAALSGCVGFKPTHGWFSLGGVHPLASSLDHVGLMARSPGDARLTFEALSGRTMNDVGHGAVEGTAVGVLAGRSHSLLSPTVRVAVDDARAHLEAAGAHVEEVDLPDVDVRVAAVLTLVRFEAERVHREAFGAHPDTYGTDLRELLDLGEVDPEELHEARAEVDRAVQATARALEECEVLLGATVPIPAPLIGELRLELCGEVFPIEFLLTRLTSLANAAGLPALSVPGVGRTKLPTGVQLMGRRNGEAAVLGLAEVLDRR